MFYLSAEDMEKCITLQEVIDAVEDAYRIYRTGNFNMPERPVVYHGEDSVWYMPCFTPARMGTKVLSMFPGNAKLGLPALEAIMIINDLQTGRIQCIMDGTRLTALRTGAAGGVGVRRLSHPESKTLGIVGTGAQGASQAAYAILSRPIQQVHMYSPSGKYSRFIAGVKALINREVGFIPCESPAEVLQSSEIVVTATMAKSAVFPEDPALLANKCFIGVGACTPVLKEYPNAIWDVCDEIYVDLEYAMEESGDLCQPIEQGLLKKEQVHLISDLFDQEPKQPGNGKSTFFKTVGMALLDVVVGDRIYQKAKEMGIGVECAL